MASPLIVKCKKVTQLHRGDRILAIRWRGCSQRRAGVSQRSRVFGTFVKRCKRGGYISVVYRMPDGTMAGYMSEHLPDSVAFVLADREGA